MLATAISLHDQSMLSFGLSSAVSPYPFAAETAPPRPRTRQALQAGKISAWSEPLHNAGLRLLSLSPGWDGPGSSAINQDVVRFATKLVADALAGIDAAEAPYLVPGGDGSVQIEWHEKRGELELDVGTDGSLHLIVRNHLTGAELEGEDEKAVALFFRWAAWVAAVSGDEVHEGVAPAQNLFEFAA